MRAGPLWAITLEKRKRATNFLYTKNPRPHTLAFFLFFFFSFFYDATPEGIVQVGIIDLATNFALPMLNDNLRLGFEFLLTIAFLARFLDTVR